MRISDWSSDVCSSDLFVEGVEGQSRFPLPGPATMPLDTDDSRLIDDDFGHAIVIEILPQRPNSMIEDRRIAERRVHLRSEEHTSELQSIMRISYAVFCLKKKTQHSQQLTHITEPT